eukprot:scaffold15510_cov213-Amphora_coffeaeformis.AAC.7
MKDGLLSIGKHGIGHDGECHQQQSNGMKGWCRLPICRGEQNESGTNSRRTSVLRETKYLLVKNGCQNHGGYEFGGSKYDLCREIDVIE